MILPRRGAFFATLGLLVTLEFVRADVEFRTRDSGTTRTFELASQEIVVTQKARRADAVGTQVMAKIPRAQVIEAKHFRATVTLPAGVGRDAINLAVPGSEVAPVLYEKGRARDARFRRVVTREVLAQLPPGWTAEQLGKFVGAERVHATRFIDHFMLTMPSAFHALDAHEALRGRGFESALQLEREMEKRFVPNDPFFSSQWHLRNNGQSNGVVGIDANVTRAQDFTKGAGITISIIDDSLQTTHPDLSPNCPPISSNKHRDFNDDDNNPAPDFFDAHGTAVGGVAAAKGNNSIGVSGVAPDAELIGVRLISGPFADSESASALFWRPAGVTVGVSNNSWGPFDGTGISGPDILTRQALEDAATLGRGGRGQVTVFAAGNGKQRNDDSNFDGYANSRFVLAVAACTNQGQQSFYSEPGANILICAPSNGGTLGVVTTDVTGNGGYNPGPQEPADTSYTNSFGGTSAASPLTAGGVALLLAVNPNLGWRDVHEIVASTARRIQPTDGDWVVNGGGFKFNHKFGGGMIDLTAAVARAQDWQNLPSETSQGRALVNPNIPAVIPDNPAAGITRNFDFSTGPNLRVEHVELIADIKHAHRSDLEIVVISPSGTRSVMAPNRPRPSPNFDDDVDYTDGGQGWSFTSTHHWGENSLGIWMLTARDRTTGTTGTLRAATLKLFGTQVASHQRLTFETQRMNAAEASGSATVRVQRIGGLQGSASVAYIVSPNGTAVAGQDYTPMSGTLIFPDGQPFADLTVPILDDAVPEGPETIYILLKTPASAALGGASLAQVDIVDDDGNFVSVTASDATAGETGAGQTADPGTFVISRAAPDNAPLTIHYTIAGTAAGGVDYATVATQATIPAFESSVPITVTPMNDSITEVAETVTLKIESRLEYTVGLPDTAVVNIVDNDLQVVSMAAPVNSVVESGGVVNFRVERNGVYPEPLTVLLSVSGTARPGIHYEVLPERIEIAAGESFVNVPLTPIDDDTYTPNKFVQVDLVESPDYLPDFRRDARINILENEPLPDTRRPILIIREPRQGVRIFEGARLIARGTARDNGEVERVQYRLNAGPWKLAEGTTAWNADLTNDLFPGLNRLEVRALDDVENLANVQKRTFTYVKTHNLNVSAPLGGSVSGGFIPSSSREAGQRYTIVATPAPGFVFNGWSGDLLSSSRSFSFVMPDQDTTLFANFIQNPFSSAITGSYAGLVQAEKFSFDTAGFLKLQLLPTGAFTGSLTYGRAKYLLKGEFTGSGVFQRSIPRTGNPIPLALDLALDLSGAQRIQGTVSTPDFSSALVAERAAVPIAPVVSRYTLVFPPLQTVTSQQPRGNGWATLTIDATGIVRWAGSLSDGTAVTGSAALNKDRRWPLFLSLYGHRGVLLGNMTLDEQQSGNDMSGFLDWSKPPRGRDRLFPLGFIVEQTSVIGSLYTAPARGERVLASFDTSPANGGTVLFREGNLKQGNFDREFDAPMTLSSQNHVTFTPPNPARAKMVIAPVTGTFSGSFIHPITRKVTPMKGVIFEKQQRGDGAFAGSVVGRSGTDQTGTVTLLPAE